MKVMCLIHPIDERQAYRNRTWRRMLFDVVADGGASEVRDMHVRTHGVESVSCRLLLSPYRPVL